jgi:hypothetical protein
MSESGHCPPPSLPVGLQNGLQGPSSTLFLSAAHSGAAPDDAGRPQGHEEQASCPTLTISRAAGACWS